VQITGGWRLPADDNAFAFGARDPDGLDDPCPALIPVGATVDGQVLVNLAATGPVSVAGDPGDVEVFLRHTLTAVHAAPWAGRVQLHAPPHLAERLDPLERLTVEDSLRPQPPSEQPDDPAGAHGPEEPGWRTAPVHVFCGWAADADLAPLLHAAGNPSRDVHLLVIGAHLDTTRWTLDGDQLTIPGLAAPVTVTVAEPDDHDIAELLRHTTTAPDVPVDDPRLPETSGAAATDNASSDVRETRPDEAVIPRLRLLGPVELDGSGRLPRSQVLNLLALLALHPRGVDRHQLLAALWPDQVVNLQTMRNRIRETRRLVNGGITDGPIWRLTNAVTTDWDQFTALAAGDVDEQRRALDLVRGRPFSGLDDADWIDLGGFRSEVEAAIVDLALTVVEHDLATENYPGAQAAARAGLLASRYEERLHRAGISAALAQGLHGLAKTLQQEMRTALDLDIEPDDQIQPETLSLIRDLRDRRPAVSDTSQR
jgi:DNA-binding SARP family transcriptional activator